MNNHQIANKLFENHQNFLEFISSLSEQNFMFSIDGKWTAGQQLDHLIRGVLPIKMAFSLPKMIPDLLFGKTDRNSRDYDAIVTAYQGKLAAGSKASKRFIPPSISFDKRPELKNKLLKTVERLCQKLDNFSPQQLDEYLLPHPILGKLTMREMLYFTMYHAEHHHRAALHNLEMK